MKITIDHSSEIVAGNDHESLFQQLKAAGYKIKSTCGGCASCGQCTVVIKEGHENLKDPTFEEKQLLGNVFHITKERLSCQTFLTGDVRVDISEHLETSKPKKSTTIRRTKEQAQEIKEQKEIERQEQKDSRPKKVGGGRRPRAFNYQDEEDANEQKD